MLATTTNNNSNLIMSCFMRAKALLQSIRRGAQACALVGSLSIQITNQMPASPHLKNSTMRAGPSSII